MMSGEFLWQLSVDVVQEARGLEPNLQHITHGTCVRNATWTKGYKRVYLLHNRQQHPIQLNK